MPKMPDPRRYVQVADLLETRIRDGTWVQGEKVSAQPVLATEFSCSIDTIQSALGRLAEKNMIIRIPGLGYYVSWEGEKEESDVLSDRNRSSGMDGYRASRGSDREDNTQ